MAATFRAEAAFIITGRGLVWAGVLTIGHVNTGDIILIRKDNATRQRRIMGIEMSTNGKVGLLIQCEDEAEMQELRHWDMAALEFQIVSGKE